MSWATLPGPGETEDLLTRLARPGPEPDFHLMHAATRALILQPTPAPAADHQATAIMQFWDQPVPPADVLASLESWRIAGPPLARFSDAAASDWLHDHYGQEVLAAYRHCHHPAMRSDLFRLAWLLRLGGLYVDADDAYGSPGPLPGFEAGLVLLPLAQFGGTIVPMAEGLAARAAGEHVGFFANNAPLYARAGHPVLQAALEGALGHLRRCMAQGVRGDIHAHTGPFNLSLAMVAHLAGCYRAGREPDVALRVKWPWLRPFLPMDYKQGPRNWRSGASLY